MKTKKKRLAPFGIRRQGAVADAMHQHHGMDLPSTLKFGRVLVVNTKTIASAKNTNNKVGAYITYDVMLSPNGIILQDVPACSSTGQINDFITSNSPSPVITGEEVPLIIGTPVLVGFVNGSNMNPIIIAPVACQTTPFSEDSTQHPQKTEYWQGTKTTADKNGNLEYDIINNGTFTIKVGGTLLCTITNNPTPTINLGTTGLQPTILGNTLNTYLQGVVSALNSHTHAVTSAPGTTGTPATGIPPTTFTDPSNILTTVVNVE